MPSPAGSIPTNTAPAADHSFTALINNGTAHSNQSQDLDAFQVELNNYLEGGTFTYGVDGENDEMIDEDVAMGNSVNGSVGTSTSNSATTPATPISARTPPADSV
ncbi:hypothetical protein AN958_11345 [Leucoagaricus sp. SymC.cos]|nr:hypothetical protein AN958_11345 [Leucoagaricus sp. SymC.cos]